MDARGVLHNLKPIGRLPVSGPDVEPRRGDSEFGSLWFTAKESDDDPDDDSAAGELPTRRRVRADGDDHVVIDLDLTGLLGGRPLPADGSREEQPQPAKPEWPPIQPADGSQPGADGTPPAADNSKPAAGTTPPAADRPRPPAEMTAAAPAPAEAPDRPTAEKSAGNGGVSLIPGPEPVLEKEQPRRPAPERRELTAADLQAIRWRLDGGTLREVVDDKAALRELGEKLDEPLADESDTVAKAGLLSVRAEVYRLLGELGMAAAASRLALAHAEAARDVQSMVIAQAELAHVLRLRADFVEADRLFGRAANAPVPAPLRSVVHENAGRCCFDQGRYMEALDHFARAVRLGRPDDNDLAERIGVCLEAVYIHVLRDGWGPYPRRSLDALGGSGPVKPGALDETTTEQPTVQPR
jgi:Tfp pilus assembly protein PilF